jgi:UDP-N-acetylglucosamine acyltransferase
MSEIDTRAEVSSSARIGRDVKIGAFAVVGGEVDLGEGCVLEHHAVVQGPARLGRGNHVYPFSVIGGDPQDLTYRGERVSLEIGDANEFREFSTVNRGTVKGGGVTRVGSHNLIMSYAHIGHDCLIGDHTIFCPVQQYCRVGKYAYIGAHTVITQDVPPFSKVASPRDSRCYGVNTIGLERQGFSAERIESIEKAYRLLLRSKLNTSQALEKMRETLAGSEDVLSLIRFIESAENGLVK